MRDKLVSKLSWTREGEKGKRWKEICPPCCCCNHHNKQEVSIPRSVLPWEGWGNHDWVGPAGLKGLTVCDSLQHMVVVGVCVHMQTHQCSASSFRAGRR